MHIIKRLNGETETVNMKLKRDSKAHISQRTCTRSVNKAMFARFPAFAHNSQLTQHIVRTAVTLTSLNGVVVN